MTDGKTLGRQGEEAAARYLMFHDYSILERNWMAGHLEVDIIAQKRGLLVFVEVKTLAREGGIVPENRVDDKKRERLVRAARAYLAINDLDQQVRFDIVSVTGAEPPFAIRHIENAFAPDPVYAERQGKPTQYR